MTLTDETSRDPMTPAARRSPRGDLHALVAAHVGGVGLAAAAEAAGMSKATAWRRLQTPEARDLIAEVTDRRRDALLGWADAVRGAADLALAAMVEVLESDPEPALVCRIAATLLPEVRATATLGDLAERLDRLEAALVEPDPRESLRKVVAL